jgi:hypothetical protein
VTTKRTRETAAAERTQDTGAAERTRHAQQAFRPVRTNEPNGRVIRTNPSCREKPNEPETSGILHVFGPRGVKRTRAGEHSTPAR